MFNNLRKYQIYILSFSFIISIISGQNLQNIGLDNNDKLFKLSEGFVIETEVDPNTYIIGPGDKIGVSIITSVITSYIMTVTPNGELWLPDIGSVHISGENILDAENTVLEFVQENRSKEAGVSLVLLNIRQFRIQVVGAVITPGFINVSSIERLTDAIRKVGGLHKLANEEYISIFRILGKDIHSSLKTFHFDGDLMNNPILKEGDIIHVPYIAEFSNNIQKSISHKQGYIFVTGFVVHPKGHKYLSGYSVNEYIAMSGGVTEFGSMKNIIIYRNGKYFSDDNDIIIQPGDQINIPANIKYRMLGNMSILQTLTAMMTLYLTYQAAIN